MLAAITPLGGSEIRILAIRRSCEAKGRTVILKYVDRYSEAVRHSGRLSGGAPLGGSLGRVNFRAYFGRTLMESIQAAVGEWRNGSYCGHNR
jgi:hypothetical protein